MGTNTLRNATDGEVIPASDHNELVTAMIEDFVPRNPSRQPQDESGQLGTSLFRWVRSYIKEMFIGAAANNNKIHEGAPNQVHIDAGGSTGLVVDSAGINWPSQPDSYIPREKLNGFAFRSIETFTLTDVEGSGVIKANLPYDALISVAFHGDGDGSNVIILSRDNFSSDDQDVYHAQAHASGVGTPTDIFINQCNTARAGSDLRYDGGNAAGGKLEVTVRLMYF